MKLFYKIALTLTFTVFGISSYASERILLKDKKIISAEVNQQTMRCSMIGYGRTELKINLKDLDGWTILDHSNSRFGEFNGAPCMTAGRCKTFSELDLGFDLDEILKNNSGEHKVTIERIVKERKELIKDEDNNSICKRTIIEELKTTIANIPFQHQRSISENFDERACRN